MKYQDIKEFSKRCDEHPDHQDGMISNSMIQQRLHEEIYELRKYLEREWVGLTLEDMQDLNVSKDWIDGARWAATLLWERNT